MQYQNIDKPGATSEKSITLTRLYKSICRLCKLSLCKCNLSTSFNLDKLSRFLNHFQTAMSNFALFFSSSVALWLQFAHCSAVIGDIFSLFVDFGNLSNHLKIQLKIVFSTNCCFENNIK